MLANEVRLDQTGILLVKEFFLIYQSISMILIRLLSLLAINHLTFLKPIIRIHLTILFIAMMAPQVMRMLRS